MKRCKDCGAEKPLDQFHKHKGMKDGHLNNCKLCKAESVRNNRANNPAVQEYDRARGNRQGTEYMKEYRLRYPKKWHAHCVINNGVRDGKITKLDNCEQCGSNYHVEGHHDDYDKPYEVRWLCSRCHKRWHAENGEAKNPF